MAMLPPEMYNNWLMWLTLTSAISVWYTVPYYLPGIEMKGYGVFVIGLSSVPFLGAAVWVSPQRIADIIYIVIVAVVAVALTTNKYHIHHSAWPWALVPLCRHKAETGSTTFNCYSIAVGIFMGMATQEISGSGFHLQAESGW